jgi:hypothetical protein
LVRTKSLISPMVEPAKSWSTIGSVVVSIRVGLGEVSGSCVEVMRIQEPLSSESPNSKSWRRIQALFRACDFLATTLQMLDCRNANLWIDICSRKKYWPGDDWHCVPSFENLFRNRWLYNLFANTWKKIPVCATLQGLTASYVVCNIMRRSRVQRHQGEKIGQAA